MSKEDYKDKRVPKGRRPVKENLTIFYPGLLKLTVRSQVLSTFLDRPTSSNVSRVSQSGWLQVESRL